jgi:glycosyltransferase involved in cell wall biosynthesis
MGKVLNQVISVIIPYYNASGTINKAVSSIVGQNNDNNNFYEIIIIDDGSIDVLDFSKINFPSIGQDYNIIIIRNQINLGVGLTRTRGINCATGDYIAFLDSDDSWNLNKTNLQLKFLEEKPEYGLVGGLTNMPGASGPFYKANDNEFYEIKLFDLMFKWYFQPSTVIIRKQYLDLIDDDIYRYAGEGWYYIQLTKYTKLALLNNILVDYDNGKRGFGKKGLTERIHYLEKSELRNYYFGLIGGNLSFLFFILATNFSILKYFRRLIICKIDEYRN